MHSIADASAIAVHTPMGVIFHSGEFKMDYTPIHVLPADLARFAELGNKGGIRRYGESTVPMDEALAKIVIDISNRPILVYRVTLKKSTTGTFDSGLNNEFFRALATNAGITLHIDLLSGDEPHHVAEAILKAFGRALDQATGFEARLSGNLPSTKGIL